ncbi:S1 family peptidase [Klebsiella pasteurii]|uniref:S1 family peptidase n=1 Tax=Klebsiella pasteurii TaxID=2587529 RepID=UPI00115C36B8|nr:serine protease [Klebsiella pasteurii]VUS54300.1 hypothetical protein SB6417_02390 [Klebsiella pasteurii]
MKKVLSVVAIGVENNYKVSFLGTGFFISNTKLVTASHVIRGVKHRLVISPKVEIKQFSDYQDEEQEEFLLYPARVIEDDPIKDICVLEAETADCDFSYPVISGLDGINVGDVLSIYGFPHCNVECRKVLTYQSAVVGAKVLLSCAGIKSKHAILNNQSRPGQSGSPVLNLADSSVVGILVGGYMREGSEGILIGDMIPGDFNQTTYCVSAEYIKEML